MRRIVVLGTAMLLASGIVIAMGDPAPPCKHSPAIVGECFTVHGRLSAWNGAPTFRIWRIGTKRILGVRSIDGDPENAIQSSVGKLVGPDAFRVDLYGDYTVCPLTLPHQGRMQMVCVDEVSHLVARPR